MSLMCHQFEIYVWCQMFSILVAWWTFIVLPVTSQGSYYHYYWVYKFWILHFDGDFWIILFLLSSNFSGFALYLYGSYNIISVTSLLDVSIEWIFRRYWMLCSDLRTKHLEFYLPTPLLFHGHISIHLSLSWKFPSQI